MRSRRKAIALIGLFTLVVGVAGGLLWLHDYYQVESVAQIGQPLSALTFTDLDEQLVSFDQYLGKKLLAVFVDLECGFCQEQFKVLEEFYGQAEHDGLVIVAIVRHESMMPVDFLQEYSSPFPLWIDSQRQLRKKLGPVGVPALFLLDEHGTLRYKDVGYQALDEVQRVIGSIEERPLSE